MRGQIEVVDNYISHSPVKKLVNLAATPAPRIIQVEDLYIQKQQPEHFYGR